MLNYLWIMNDEFRRQRAAWPNLKIGGADKGKVRGKSGPAWESNGTHTTLPLCVPAVPENRQKTAIYGPRRTHSGARKAQISRKPFYGGDLEAAYFNGLSSRPRLSSYRLAEC